MFTKFTKKIINKGALKNTWKGSVLFSKRTYFGGVAPDYATLGISPQVRADPWVGIERTRVAQEQITQDYKPRSADGTVAGKLATELYSRMQLADKLNNTNKYSKAVMEDTPKVKQFSQTELGKLIFFTENPIETRLQMLDEAFTDMNINFVTRYFFAYVVAEQQAVQLNNIFAVWEKYMKEKKGIREAKLITASKLSEAEEQHFETIIKDALCTPEGTLLLEKQVDPSLLGGFKIEIGGTTIDRSWQPAKAQWDQWVREEEEHEQQLLNSVPKLA